jgi:signal transduction histidine kinase
MLRLTVKEGKEKGEVFVSREASVGLGTAMDNGVQLTDPFVSRHHGKLALDAGRWTYQDLGSSNGSAVDRSGERVILDRESKPVAMVSGDLLLVGETVLRFEVAEPAALQPQQTAIASRSLADLALRAERHLASAEGLNSAYELERLIGLNFDPEKVLDSVLDCLLTTFPAATHVIILLVDRATGRPRRQIAKARGEEGRAGQDLRVSMSVASHVLKEGESLLFLDVPSQFADSSSVAAAGITSTMCAPLWTGEETVGLIQVDKRGGAASFTEADLERLCFLASRAAAGIIGSELCESEQRNRLLRDLSAMITHDLKGPLTSIMGFLELLSREELTGEQREFVEIALGSSRWLSVLIAGILEAAKLEAGQVTLQREALNVAGEVEAALGALTYQLREKDIKLEVALPADLPLVEADRELFRRVVMNLVGNAVRFSPMAGKVALSAVMDEPVEAVVVSVRDEGPGVAREHQASIFDKFVQVAKGKSSEKVSVGLGLAFCKLAVEAHGGSIWVESEPGGGACFSFSLPLAGAQAGS